MSRILNLPFCLVQKEAGRFFTERKTVSTSPYPWIILTKTQKRFRKTDLNNRLVSVRAHEMLKHFTVVYHIYTVLILYNTIIVAGRQWKYNIPVTKYSGTHAGNANKPLSPLR